MARKNHERKAGGSRKAPGGKPSVGRPAVAKAKAATKAAPKRAAAPASPPPPKVKFRGRVLENEPLARYTTYRIGGPARYPVLPGGAGHGIKALGLAQGRGPPWFAPGPGPGAPAEGPGLPGASMPGGQVRGWSGRT